ncbi:MAG TPA: lysophospholipid acyltransferase family protein [Thermoanaerobaculia bacterium]|nr:lysophospholipid acyltransferase family protein [Thermoanaerobaculia bacterium]
MTAKPAIFTSPAVGGARQIFARPLPALPGRHRQILLKTLLAAFGRMVEIAGAERLSATPEPALFALNHSNAAESLLVPAVLFYLRGRPIHFLADWMFLDLPLVGPLLRLGEPIPVYGKRARFGWRDRRRRRRAAEPVLDACLARLREGRSVGLFPEGTRNPDPAHLLPGRPGLGQLVLRSSAPVVPIGVRYPAARDRAPLFGRAELHVGAPLDFSAERALFTGIRDEPGWGRTRRALGRRIVCTVMENLSELSGKRPPQTTRSAKEETPCAPVP